MSPFAHYLSSIILLPISSGPFHSLPFFRKTLSVFQRVLLSGEPYSAEQKLSQLAPLDSSPPCQSSPAFSLAPSERHVPPPSPIISFNLFHICPPLRWNLGAPTTAMVLISLQRVWPCNQPPSPLPPEISLFDCFWLFSPADSISAFLLFSIPLWSLHNWF